MYLIILTHCYEDRIWNIAPVCCPDIHIMRFKGYFLYNRCYSVNIGRDSFITGYSCKALFRPIRQSVRLGPDKCCF